MSELAIIWNSVFLNFNFSGAKQNRKTWARIPDQSKASFFSTERFQILSNLY